MTAIEDIQTPSLILDREVLDRNIGRMSEQARRLGMKLRPHLKTAKSIDVARRIAAARTDGIAVSTLREAEYFLDHGIDDIFYCAPFAPDKLPALAALRKRGADLKLLVTCAESARLLVEWAGGRGLVLPALVELDVDGYRTGIGLADPDLLATCRLLRDADGTAFAGVMTYAGASYAGGAGEAARVAEAHRRGVLQFREAAAAIGLDCPIASFGASPATVHAGSLAGFSEIRCGTFMFNDLYQAGIGACQRADIALSVLATVVSRQPRLNRLVVDAGALALSKDRSTEGTAFDSGYGLVCDVRGALVEDLYVSAVSQELGIVTSRSGRALDPADFPLGSKLRILPNHADLTAAAHDRYHVIDQEAVVRELWPRANGWRAG